jgi:broad specificity phosphatase PhoE
MCPPPATSLMSMLLPHQILPRVVVPRAVTPLPKAEEKDRTYLVYLIRHGEASHNVLEKAAMQRAKEQAEAQGLSPEQVKERVEQARVAVLTDESLRDASLSAQGRQDAERARRQLNDVVRRHDLSLPCKVLVSPLTRALETADLIFPNHDTIHVREELQERQTGKPCDCRQSSTHLSSRPSFQRFQMGHLRNNSFLQKEDSSSSNDDDSSFEEEGQVNSCSRPWASDSRSNRPPRLDRRLSDPGKAEEDKATLRVRTQKLLGLLDEPSIAVVTHKGYLRELERGTLGQADAKEFDNAEIRVYRIHLDSNRALEKAERVV